MAPRRLELNCPGASPEEAAAIMAALQRFLGETAPAPLAGDARAPAWLRSALLEGVERESDGLTAWGDASPWG